MLPLGKQSIPYVLCCILSSVVLRVGGNIQHGSRKTGHFLVFIGFLKFLLGNSGTLGAQGSKVPFTGRANSAVPVPAMLCLSKQNPPEGLEQFDQN